MGALIGASGGAIGCSGTGGALIGASGGAIGCSGTGGVLIGASGGAIGCSGTGGVLIGASGATELTIMETFPVLLVEVSSLAVNVKPVRACIATVWVVDN